MHNYGCSYPQCSVAQNLGFKLKIPGLKGKKMSREHDALNPIQVPINRFIFVMKALAEDDLWDDAAAYLQDHGHVQVTVDEELLRLIQDMLKHMVANGEPVSRRALRFMLSATCGPLPPPRFPPPPPPPPRRGAMIARIATKGP
jgi:hypothetical protein